MPGTSCALSRALLAQRLPRPTGRMGQTSVLALPPTVALEMPAGEGGVAAVGLALTQGHCAPPWRIFRGGKTAVSPPSLTGLGAAECRTGTDRCTCPEF